MKKVKSLLKSNVKVLFAFILGVIVFNVSSAIFFESDQVSYTKNNQSTLKGALDELYMRLNTWIDPSNIDFGTITINSNKTILASSAGMCIKRNNKVSCFKANNIDYNIEHMQQAFSDVSCNVYSDGVSCSDSNLKCEDGMKGLACWDYSISTPNCITYGNNGCLEAVNYSACYISNGRVTCN